LQKAKANEISFYQLDFSLRQMPAFLAIIVNTEKKSNPSLTICFETFRKRKLYKISKKLSVALCPFSAGVRNRFFNIIAPGLSASC